MNWRQLPVLPTLVVLAATATMVALGFWQLGRADEKAALIARYSAVDAAGPAAPLNERGVRDGDQLYRAVTFDCATVGEIRSTAGTNADGEKGWAHVASCGNLGGSAIRAAIGWSRGPDTPEWDGGPVTGVLGPNGKIVADPAQAGLQPLARPDPGDLPNNHLAYAGQWFLFALTALVIYFFAVRNKLTERREGED